MAQIVYCVYFDGYRIMYVILGELVLEILWMYSPINFGVTQLTFGYLFLQCMIE